MRVIEDGHIYEFAEMDGLDNQTITFVNRETGTQHPGIQTQDALRALIDRTQHCNSCLPWDGNEKIIQHLRMALVLHESRALERKVEKRIIEPEHIQTSDVDGHFALAAASKL